MPFEPKLIVSDEIQPREPFGPDADFSELPDELAGLALQLNDDAELLARGFPSPPAEGRVQQLWRQDSSPRRWVWLASPWTRAAALLLLCSAATLGVLLLGDDQKPGVVGVRIRPEVNHPVADVPSPDRFAERKTRRESPRESSREPESSASPVYISADEAEFLNGEKIEVLADIHAEQIAEI